MAATLAERTRDNCPHMELGTFSELLTPEGESALASALALAPTESAFLSCFEKLRKRFPAALAKAALETVILREKARAKFTHAARMYFTREALEQASGDVIAQYRVTRFTPFGVVADLCCGIGGDTLALAPAGLIVHAVEYDALRAAMTRANASALGFGDRIHVHEADACTIALPGVRAVFADPSRRAWGNRHLDPEDYTPPLSAIRARFAPDVPLGVKIAPGVAWADIAGLDAEAEFISVDGQLKECVLWFGLMRSASRRATVLPEGRTLATHESPPLPDVGPVLDFVFDPDPAMMRAGLVGVLAEQLGVHAIDHSVTLLSGSRCIHSPFLTGYRVEWSAHYHPRRLNEYCRQHGIGRVTPVQIGSRMDPREVMKRLKLAGSGHRVVILTQVGGEQWMIMGERVHGKPGASAVTVR